MPPVTVPANFGLEFRRIRSNDVELQLKDDKTLLANAVVLALNSEVIRNSVLLDRLPLDFKLFDEEPVNLFLDACYQGRLCTLNKEHMAQVHLISHNYQVFWIIDAVFEDFRRRVKRCGELQTFDYESSEFLFKEAVQVYRDTRKRNFVDTFIQQFGKVPEKKKEFLDVFCKKMLMEGYCEDEVKIAVEMSGSQLESVINAMVLHLSDRGSKGLGPDDNTRCLLRNIDFVFLKGQNPGIHHEIMLIFANCCEHLNKDDWCMVMGTKGDETKPSTSWDRNTTLPNLFTTKESLEDTETQEYDNSTDSNEESVTTDPPQDNLQGLSEAYQEELLSHSFECENDDQSLNSSLGRLSIGQVGEVAAHGAESDSDESEYSDCVENQPPALQHEDTVLSLDTTTTVDEVIDVEESECQQSTDSSNSDVEDTAKFKERMRELCYNEHVCSLYVLIEDLWYWILDSGDKRLDINFVETMDILKDIKIYRGWFSVSKEFVQRLDNPSGNNKNLIAFRKALEEAKSLICDEGCRISSRRNYCIRTMLENSNEAKIAFEYCPPEAKTCQIQGKCGFLFKASTSSNGHFDMKLCYAESEYRGLNLHLHYNLIFAQRMHVMLSGRNGYRYSDPLSWEGRPEVDKYGIITKWGRNNFMEHSEPEPQTSKNEHRWQSFDQASFEVYYCSD